MTWHLDRIVRINVTSMRAFLCPPFRRIITGTSVVDDGKFSTRPKTPTQFLRTFRKKFRQRITRALLFRNKYTPIRGENKSVGRG